MKNMKLKTTIGITILLGAALTAAGCGGKGNDSGSVSVPKAAMMSPISDIELINTEGKVLSDLTGQWIDQALNDRRPMAVMINNIGEAMPQSGIGQADVIYEMVVEGGITRLMAVYSDYSGLTKIGPVRSARQYYVRSAEQMDAVYCHVGGSTLGYSEIESSGIDDLDGLTGVGNYFIYRDNSRVAPHNAYASAEGLDSAIEHTGINMTHKSSYDPMFAFSSKNKDIENGSPASKITTAFNSSRAPWFEYNAEEKQYYRFQYGDKQIDDQTGEQLHFQNVLILFAETYSPDGYLMEVCNEDSGDGYYASNGQYIPIRWRYENGTVHYYLTSGEQLMMNPGKTWITFFDAENTGGITFE